MTKQEVGQYVMERTLREVVRNHWGIVQNLPGMEAMVAQWDVNVLRIDAARKIQEVSVKGFCVQKKQLREEMTEVMLDVCRKMFSYGRMTGNEVVAATTAYSKRDFVNAADTVVRDIAEVVWKCAYSELGNVGAYGVDEALLAKGRAAIDRYVESIAEPRLAAVKRKGATRIIGDLLRQDLGLLQGMDLLMELVRLSEPGFYGQYCSARRVYVMGRERMALKLRVVDVVSGEGISGVKVVVRTSEKGEVVMRKVTAAGGGVCVRNMANGRYWVDFLKTGFGPEGREVFVNTGEMWKMEVGMGKRVSEESE